MRYNQGNCFLLRKQLAGQVLQTSFEERKRKFEADQAAAKSGKKILTPE